MKRILKKDIQKSFRELSSLYLMTSQINETHNIETIFSLLKNIINEICPYNSIKLMLYDDESGELQFELNENDKSYLGDDLPLPENIMSWIFDNRKIRIIPMESIAQSNQTGALVLVPLISYKHFIGIIQILIPVSPGEITIHFEQMLWIVANNVASAIHNSRLMNELERQNSTLHKLESHLTSLFDDMIHGIMVVEDTGTILMMSKTIETVFKISDENVFGKIVDDVFSENISSMLNNMLLEVIKNSEISKRNFDFVQENGQVIPLQITASPLEQSDLKYGIIFELKSLNDSKNLMAVAEVDRLKSNFVATVSHEFKTPLNLILGSTNLLTEGLVGNVNEKQQKLLKLITDGTNRLMDLTKNLLDLAKIEAEKGNLELEQLSLKNLIEIAVTNLAYTAKEKEVSIEDNIDELYEQIIGDRQKILQMIIHLISNAVNYNKPGGYVKISVSEWEKDNSENFIKLCIEDNGIGITPEDHENVFSEFHRVNDPDLQEIQGHGLGLTIVKKIVELHRGKIIISSNTTEGTNVTVILPRDIKDI